MREVRISEMISLFPRDSIIQCLVWHFRLVGVETEAWGPLAQWTGCLQWGPTLQRKPLWSGHMDAEPAMASRPAQESPANPFTTQFPAKQLWNLSGELEGLRQPSRLLINRIQVWTLSLVPHTCCPCSYFYVLFHCLIIVILEGSVTLCISAQCPPAPSARVCPAVSPPEEGEGVTLPDLSHAGQQHFPSQIPKPEDLPKLYVDTPKQGLSLMTVFLSPHP